MDVSGKPSIGEALLEAPIIIFLLIVLVFVHVLGITIGWRFGKKAANKIVSPAEQNIF